jgi:Trypsin-co-occurring domain 2
MQDGDGEPLRFALGPVQVELTIAATASAGADGKIGVWRVVTIGGKAEHSSSSTHHLTLTLTPLVAGASPTDDVIIGQDLPRRPQ